PGCSRPFPRMTTSVVDLAFYVSHHRESDLLKIAIARGTAHHDFELPRLYHVLHVDVVEGKLLGRDVERDAVRLARLQENLAKRLQLLDGPRGRTEQVAYVPLHNFRACARSGVGHVEQESGLAIARHSLLGQVDIFDGEGGVAQAVAKGVKR